MKYALALLTHGDNEAVLTRTLDSFAEHVSPAPAERIVMRDGPAMLPPIDGFPWVSVQHPDRRGFCAATERLWSEVAGIDDVDFVFWLEHDFVFVRPVELSRLADALRHNRALAQVSLMRQPVNERERATGGVVESFPAGTFMPVARSFGTWLEHTAYFTTNPSLLRREFMALNPWPSYPRACEGRFTLDLVRRGFRFGVWGHGERWVEHVGQRNGSGY